MTSKAPVRARCASREDLSRARFMGPSAKLLRHLESCETCATEWRALEELAALGRRVATHPPHPQHIAVVRRELLEGIEGNVPSRLPIFASSPWKLWALAFCTSLLVVALTTRESIQEVESAEFVQPRAAGEDGESNGNGDGDDKRQPRAVRAEDVPVDPGPNVNAPTALRSMGLAERSFESGWRNFQNGHFEEARKDFASVTLGKGAPALEEEAQFWLSMTLVELHRDGEAIARLDDFIWRFPASPRRGEASVTLGRLKGVRDTASVGLERVRARRQALTTHDAICE